MDDFDGKLVFSQPHDGTGRLVFGEQGAVVVPDAVFGLDADLPGLGTLTLHAGAMLGLDADLPGLDDSTVVLQWDANVSRGGLRAELESAWQQALPVAGAVQSHWQKAANLRAPAIARWQEGRRQHGALVARWEATDPLRAAVASHWQEGDRIRAGLAARWEEGVRHRAAVTSAWQEGAAHRAAVASAWQEMRRLRAAVATVWQAQGVPMRRAVAGRWSSGMPMPVALRTRWQEAMRPPPGVTSMPQPELPEPCYDPATLGRLVFTDLALGNGRLVFLCLRPGEVLPPATIVVLPSRSYIVVNSVEIRRADALAGNPLPSEGFQMQLNRQSWTWSWSADFHASARDALAPGLSGQPVEVEVRVNGQPFRLLAERFGRSKRFPEHMVRVAGRGKAAVLDAPVAVQTFSQALDRTAQQLMGEALTLNGVGMGWSVDFQLADWLVPGGIWMHRGTPISALADIAGAVGGYLQPHDTDQVLRVLPSWPAPWWEWAGIEPDIELPAGIAEIEDMEIVDLPLYNRIIVSGEAGGIAADLTRNGTPGDVLKQPMAVHALLTEIGANKQRARAELSESGRMIKYKMTLPLHQQTGIIKPGTFLRYTDDDAALRLGLVRGTNVASQFPVLTQALEIDSHV